MTPLIISLLQISLIMSVLALALHLLMNLFANSISPKWKYYIWGIVLVSFLIPFRPKVLNPIVTVDAPSITENTTNPAGSAIESGTTQAGSSEASFLSGVDLPTLILWIWIVGVVIFLAIVFIKHLRFMSTAKRWGSPVDSPNTVKLVNDTMAEMNIKTDLDVIRSKMVSVPMMAGVFKPVLFLPVYDLDEEELKYVIRHELVHYRKFDILVKFLSVLANAVHWFNPLVYVMQRWIHTDCEVACDYEVTRTYEKEERIRYVETIIGVAKHEIKYKTVFSTNFYDGKKTMKKRLESVLTANKMRSTLVIVLVAAVVITCIAAGSALAVSTSDNEASTPYITEEKAKSIALEKTGGGELMTFNLETVDGNRVYKIEITNGDYEYDLIINAKSGEVTSYEKVEVSSESTSNNSSSDSNSNSGSGSTGSSGSSGSRSSSDSSNSASSTITSSKAKSIALSRVGGGTVTECELDTDSGVKKYEIKITYKGYEYDVEVNATSGNVISVEKEKIDEDD